MLRSKTLLAGGAVVALVWGCFGATPVHAASTQKKVALAFDTWYDLNLEDGPVTVHRMRIERKHESVRAKLCRPGKSEHLQDIQVQIEYSNHDKKDWKALVRLELVDGSDATIDGLQSEENLDDGSDHAKDTITIPTLIYGLDRAKTLQYEISIGRQ